MVSAFTDRFDGAQFGQAIKSPCVAVTNAAITLSGEQTVNSVACTEGDRVLVKDQADAVENGIYVCETGAWNRAPDFDGNRDIVRGTLITVNKSTGQDYFYQITTANPITIGTSELSMVLVNDPSISWPIIASETSAGFTAGDITDSYELGNMLRYGIVPNDSTTATKTANTTAINLLFDPEQTGPVGKFWFPNTTGTDTYYFNDICEIRSGCHLDLGHCTLDFAKTYAAADDRMGFFTFIRDVSIENGSINVNYDGSAGTNAGMIMRIGGRTDYGFGALSSIEDEDWTIPMGLIGLKNLRLTSNNPGPLFGVLMLGGIEGIDVENVTFNGSDVIEHGFYYEFGDYHYEATVANRTSSHAINVHFKNIKGYNLNDDGASGAVVALIGVGDAKLEGIYGDVCVNVVEFRPGEALYYRVGAPYVVAGHTRHVVLENINGQNLAGSGMQLIGAEAASGGYLSGEGLSEAEQTDLIAFSVDGFSFDQTIATVKGPLSLRNGVGKGGGSSGGLILGDECVQFEIDNIQVLDSAGDGIRANIADGIWSTPRLKVGSIRNSQVAGSATGGIVLASTRSVLIENNRLGYDALYDETAETTQDNGVNAAATAAGVVCRGNHVKTNSGTAYVKAGSDGDRNCNIEGATGEVTFTAGQWKLDGMAQANDTDIANDTASINANDKYAGKLVYDSTNKRVLRATGAVATDDWEIVDGSAQVTPV